MTKPSRSNVCLASWKFMQRFLLSFPSSAWERTVRSSASRYSDTNIETREAELHTVPKQSLGTRLNIKRNGHLFENHAAVPPSVSVAGGPLTTANQVNRCPGCGPPRSTR